MCVAETYVDIEFCSFFIQSKSFRYFYTSRVYVNSTPCKSLGMVCVPCGYLNANRNDIVTKPNTATRDVLKSVQEIRGISSPECNRINYIQILCLLDILSNEIKS